MVYDDFYATGDRADRSDLFRKEATLVKTVRDRGKVVDDR